MSSVSPSPTQRCGTASRGDKAQTVPGSRSQYTRRHPKRNRDRRRRPGWLLQQWSRDAEDREQTAISNMKGARAKDRLLSLLRREVITQSQYRAWTAIRNASAHARPPSWDNKDKLQRWLHRCQKVVVPMYRLVFDAIGYRGIFTDYGKQDWPIAWYPKAPGTGRPGGRSPCHRHILSHNTLRDLREYSSNYGSLDTTPPHAAGCLPWVLLARIMRSPRRSRRTRR